MQTQFWHETKILEVVTGSHGYGLATSQSDLDLRGVCMLPAEYLLGLQRFEQGMGPGEDQVTYGLPKFVALALDANPNILELLFPAEHNIRFINALGRRLLDSRSLFLSQKIYHTFKGYAFSQRKRMERHHRWLTGEAPVEPGQRDFGGEWDGQTWRFVNNDQEQAYRSARKHWQEYETWRKNRNPARAAMESQFGYDTKHAMHFLRALLMGAEVLVEGTLYVDRTGRDADWLRSVREGALSYEALLAVADEADAALDAACAATMLPHTPDRQAVETMLIEMQQEFLKGGA